jgi:membrane protein involved in colicin uptake
MEHTARVQRALAQAEAERRQAQQLAEQARAAAEAASAATAQVQRERAEAEARTAAAARQRAIAEEQARQRAEKEAQARIAAEQRAADAAARAQREQAAREQAEREQAQRDQARRDQAEREQAARDQAAREAAARARSTDMEQRMAEVRRGKFSGSLGISLGDFAAMRNIPVQDLTAQTASPACGKFAEQVPVEEARNFRALCLWLPEYASRNRMRLGIRATTTQWMAYCGDRADYVRAEGDARRALINTCLKYR